MTALTANFASSAPRSLLPALARFAIAVAVGTVLTAVWVGAGAASHEAVDTSASAIAPATVRFVKLPDVEIVGRRAAKHTNA